MKNNFLDLSTYNKVVLYNPYNQEQCFPKSVRGPLWSESIIKEGLPVIFCTQKLNNIGRDLFIERTQLILMVRSTF